MTGHAPEEKYKPDSVNNARRVRGAANTKRASETPPFDWDKAIALARKTLNSRRPKK